MISFLVQHLAGEEQEMCAHNYYTNNVRYYDIDFTRIVQEFNAALRPQRP